MSKYTLAGWVGICYLLAAAAVLAANPRPPFHLEAHFRPAAGAVPGDHAAVRTAFEPAVGEDVGSDFVCNSEGKFSLPSNCTHYIHCSDDLKATLVACPACQLDSDNCPDGRWHFSIPDNDCVLPKDAFCGPPTTPTTTTTTQKPGEECDVDCTQKGECLCYDTCVPDNSSSTGGRMRRQWCDKLPDGSWLYWNNDTNLYPDGGKCDFFDNLHPDLQEYYRNLPDADCPTPPIDCFWREHETCDNKLYYLPSGQKNEAQKQEIRCPKDPKTGEPLWWSQERLTCVFDCPKLTGPCREC